jgi:hypothetical protein
MAHPFKAPLIPADAGTQAWFEFCPGSHQVSLGSRMRGNERNGGNA